MEAIENIILKLEPYIELDGGEWGEATGLLVGAFDYSYAYSDEFNKILEDEIRAAYAHIITCCEIVEVTKTYEKRVRELRDL